MPFTFAENNESNVMQTPDLAISIDPSAGIINHEFDAGGEDAGTITVTNTGQVNAEVYLSADWGPSAGTTDRHATLLANALAISVFVSSDDEGMTWTDTFGGRFMDLIDEQIIPSLGDGNTADVAISVMMPGNHSGPTLLNKSIVSDFVFVAVSTA